MSLEQKIEALTAAIEANTAAIHGAASTVTAPKADKAPADDTKKPRGRPAGSKAKPKDDDLGGDDLGDGNDGLDDGDGLDDAPAFTYQDCRTAMIALRDIGGEKANSADAKKVMVKFSLTSFADLDGQDDKYNEVMAYIKQLAKAKKVDL